MPTKFSIMLWKIKWNHLTTFQRLRDWGLQNNLACLLHTTQEHGTKAYLFFNYPYYRNVVLAVAEALNNSFWKLASIPIPTHPNQTLE